MNVDLFVYDLILSLIIIALFVGLAYLLGRVISQDKRIDSIDKCNQELIALLAPKVDEDSSKAHTILQRIDEINK